MNRNRDRRREQGRINDSLGEIRRAVGTLHLQRLRGELDTEREGIMWRLQRVLNIIDNDRSYRDGLSRLDVNGLREYADMLSGLLQQIMQGGTRRLSHFEGRT